ncbi:MAG: DNA cytosine methyltransferase [Candidatus Thiodiazotropha sp.]
MKKISAVDLFCGVGGLTYGLKRASIVVRAGYDIDPICEYPYEHNNNASFLNKDVSKVKGEDLSCWYKNGEIRLLAGCAPCQPFSSYSQGRDTSKDKKWPLLYEFARLINELEPELVTMENVPDVVKHEVYHDFVEQLLNQDYHIFTKDIYCPEYGMPQIRTRHVLLASKLGPISLNYRLRKPNQYKTVSEAIGNLPAICAGGQDPKDSMHKAASLSEVNMRRMIASRPGGSWWDWPEDLRAECHRKSSGHSYSGVYARMRWDKPSPTITTQCYGYGNGRFGHPEQNRAISLREAAILQTFPKKYRFVEPGKQVEFKTVGRMIGNAVPVKLGEVIGRSICKHVRDYSMSKL